MVAGVADRRAATYISLGKSLFLANILEQTERLLAMNRIALALALVFVAVVSTAEAAWYVGPTVVQAYYPVGPVYAYPAPVVMPVAPAPYVAYTPLAVAPVAPAAVWVARPAVVVRGKVYLPGRPIRNAVRAVVP